MSICLKSKPIVEEIYKNLKSRVLLLTEKEGMQPTLATILVGDDPASITYVNMKVKACKKVGLDSKQVKLPQNTTTEQLLLEIDKLNRDKSVFGILLQHPVPKQIDERACFDKIALNKDVDGVTTAGFGKMAMGESAFVSATPKGIITLLKKYKIPMEGKHAVVVGRSPILGKPLSLMLLNENATVTICHSKTENLKEQVSRGDIVVGAVGSPELIKAKWLKKGAVLVDAGYNKGNIGDTEWEKASESCSAYTPVPGGVGPMTIVSLIEQTVLSAEKTLIE